MDSVCRTCLTIIKNDTLLHHLNHSKPTNDLNNREKLEACVPELTIDIVLEPVICNSCKEKLAAAYYFKNQCLETEKTLFNFFQRRKQNQNCTDLLNNYDLLALVKDDIILEHNYSNFKQLDYIEYVDGGEKSYITLPSYIQSCLNPIVEQAKEKSANKKLPCASPSVNNDDPKATDDATALEAIETIANYETVDDSSFYDNDIIDEDPPETSTYTKPKSLETVVKKKCNVQISPKKNKLKGRRIKRTFYASRKQQKKRRILKNDVESTIAQTTQKNNTDLPDESSVTKVEVKPVTINNVSVPENAKQTVQTENKRQKRKQLQPKKFPQEQSKENSEPKIPEHKENGAVQDNKENVCKNDENVIKENSKTDADTFNGEHVIEPFLPIPPIVKAEGEIDDRRKPKLTYRSKKRFQCTKCDKGYNYRCHFDVHLKSHIFKKLYSCPLCDKSFSQDKYLRSHRLMHTRKALYQCALCNKCLSTRTALQRHITTHTGSRPFACTLCDKRFSQKIQLAVHQRTHTGVRPFICNICNSMFTQKSHLLGHMRIHTGERPYECAKCPKRFPKSNALRIHMQCHENKPHQCSGCNKLFKDLCSYKKHVKKNLLKCVAGRRLFRAEKLKARAVPKPEILQEIDNDIIEINRSLMDDSKTKLKRLKYFCKICRKGFTTNFSRNRHFKFQHQRIAP